MFKRVLLCYDGTAAGRHALRRGAELAIFLGSQVHVLSIVPSGALGASLMAGATGHACLADERRSHREMLEESLTWLKEHGVAAEGHLASGDTINVILAHTKQLKIDLIVLGHYPRPSGGFWWGNTHRTSLAEQAQCCVFVAVAAPEEEAASAPSGT